MSPIIAGTATRTVDVPSAPPATAPTAQAVGHYPFPSRSVVAGCLALLLVGGLIAGCSASTSSGETPSNTGAPTTSTRPAAEYATALAGSAPPSEVTIGA
jgi:hypothetical protein